MNWRAQPPALAGTGCGCFLPDLTRFTRLRCGEARRFTLCRSETPSAVSFSQAVSQALEGVRKVPFFVRILLHRGAFRAMVSTPCARKPPGVFFCAGRQIGGGESGIRTHGTRLTYTRFPSVRLKPLGHLSAARGFYRRRHDKTRLARAARELSVRSGAFHRGQRQLDELRDRAGPHL